MQARPAHESAFHSAQLVMLRLPRRVARALAALLLSASAVCSAQLQPSPAVVTEALLAPPAACSLPLAADKMANVAAFIWAGCPQLLKWPHDAAIRMSGPAPSGADSVHGYVLNYYAPAVYAWLKAGRPVGGIPDGSVILKQMYNSNPNGSIGAVNGWALVVKKKSASFDGWFWGYADPKAPTPSPTDPGFGGQFYDPNCVACHGSASTPELTFSSLVNLATTFGGTGMPDAVASLGLKGGSLHSKVALLSLTAPKSASAAAAAAPPAPPIPNTIPSQANSKLIVGPNGATRKMDGLLQERSLKRALMKLNL